MYNHKIKTSLFSPKVPKARAQIQIQISPCKRFRGRVKVVIEANGGYID